jgi:hypothetical protein
MKFSPKTTLGTPQTTLSYTSNANYTITTLRIHANYTGYTSNYIKYTSNANYIGYTSNYTKYISNANYTGYTSNYTKYTYQMQTSKLHWVHSNANEKHVKHCYVIG